MTKSARGFHAKFKEPEASLHGCSLIRGLSWGVRLPYQLIFCPNNDLCLKFIVRKKLPCYIYLTRLFIYVSWRGEHVMHFLQKQLHNHWYPRHRTRSLQYIHPWNHRGKCTWWPSLLVMIDEFILRAGTRETTYFFAWLKKKKKQMQREYVADSHKKNHTGPEPKTEERQTTDFGLACLCTQWVAGDIC